MAPSLSEQLSNLARERRVLAAEELHAEQHRLTRVYGDDTEGVARSGQLQQAQQRARELG